MRIRNLSLTNFRCFKRAEIEFSDRLNLVYGNNAQGKTSILEAINFLSLLTSPLASHDREILNFESLKDDKIVLVEGYCPAFAEDDLQKFLKEGNIVFTKKRL